MTTQVRILKFHGQGSTMCRMSIPDAMKCSQPEKGNST